MCELERHRARQRAGRRASETRAEPHMQVLDTHTEPCGVPFAVRAPAGRSATQLTKGKCTCRNINTTVEHIATDFPCRC